MRRIRIAIVNLLVFLLLAVLAEGGYRLIRFGTSCVTGFPACQSRFLANPPPVFLKLGLMAFDPVLGYAPNPGFRMVMPREAGPRWEGRSLSIGEHGFRLNDNETVSLDHGKPILVAGDSFTFGNEVSNHQTWPACLERRLKRRVDNAGVSGYGCAQALLRMETLLAETGTDYAAVALALLVGDDFDRDRLAYRSGTTRRAVVGQSLDALHYSPVSDPNVRGSKFAADSLNELNWYQSLLVSLRNRSWLVRLVEKNTNIIGANAKRLRTEVHPDAAPKELIIEWTLRRFSEIPKPKILILQYSMRPTEDALEERDLILSIAKKYDLTVVDTLEATRGGETDIEELYVGHHTPLGNEIVCEQIIPLLEDLITGSRLDVIVSGVTNRSQPHGGGGR